MHLQHTMLNLVVTTSIMILVAAAQDGPIPPRLNIPGALPIPLRPQFRNEKVRLRRPIALRTQNVVPAIAQRINDEPKPVTEGPEEDNQEAFIPQLLRDQQIQQAQQAQFQQTAQQFFGEPNSIQQDAPEEVQRFQERPAPNTPVQAVRVQQQQQQPATADYGAGSQRFGLDRPQQGPHLVRSRPSGREPRPQFVANPQPVVRQRPQQIQSRPIDQNNLNHDQEVSKRRKPVSQILRKYRDENEDGSITWGYENDDGSFKEELIGTDCVTKGTYGYIDPDGNKRQYHYETGIKCDPNTRETAEQELEQTGFVNYEQNKATLPNGLEIDLSSMGKRKSKRPGAVLYQH